jgi:hypothetical protein
MLLPASSTLSGAVQRVCWRTETWLSAYMLEE